MQFIDKNLIRALAVSVWLLAAGTAHAAGTITGAAAGGSGGVGGGDASLAEQQTQTGLLTTIDGDTGTISTNSSTLAGAVKAEDAAHTSGDAGVMALCVRQDTAAALAGTDGDYIPCTTDADGRVHTTNAAIDGTKIRAMMVDSSGNEIVIPTAGLIHNIVSAASTNATNVVAGAATAYHISLRNTTTTAYSFRLYNTVGAPTCSSATGYVTTVIAPPASAAGQVGGSETPLNIGAAFPTGLSYCITGGPTSTDNTNAAVGVYGFIMYKAN